MLTEPDKQTALPGSVVKEKKTICKHNDMKSWFNARLRQDLDALYGVARRLTCNSADAEDLVADTAVKAWRAIDSLQDKTRFRAWIFRILHNRFISDYRKRTARPQQFEYVEYDGEGANQEIAKLLIQQSDAFLNWWANPEQEVINSMLGEDIMHAIEELPVVFRVTVLLINVEGFSYDETADILGISPGTVRSRMNRGRTLLQKALWQQARDTGLIVNGIPTENDA